MSGQTVSSVCVFCSSSNDIDPRFHAVAAELGTALGTRRCELIFGGTDVGAMGVLARAHQAAGGHVASVVPRVFIERGIAFNPSETLLQTRDLHERKEVMIERADAFVILPGGTGTLDEFFEVLAVSQLGFARKPIVVMNTDGFFDTLFRFMDELHAKRFLAMPVQESVVVVPDAVGVLRALGLESS